MQLLLTLLADCAWKAGIIQENIFRNRKIGEDPQSRKWHWWQGFQYVAVGAMQAALYPAYILVEMPLTILFWILFQGFNNIRTFKREWWYVGDTKKIDEHGSAIDRWFLRRSNPKLAMQRAQFGCLALSLIPLILYYLLQGFFVCPFPPL